MAITLADALARRGWDCWHAASALEAIAQFRARRPIDLVVLDLALAGVDAVQLGARLRAAGAGAVLVLTDTGDLAARARALSGGADDYLVKPVSITELAARARAVVRYARGDTVTVVGDVHIDRATRIVTVAGQPVRLTRKQRDLLVALAAAHGAVVSRQRLLVDVWQTDWQGGAQTIAVHVSTVRTQLGRPDTIQTVHGTGYRLASRG